MTDIVERLPGDWYERWQDECTKDHGEYPDDQGVEKRLRWWRPKSAKHGSLTLEDDLIVGADEIERLRAERDALRADAERLRAALEVYADPSFYHACSFMFDRPTGGFDEDFDYDDEYERDMPGKHARETLAAIDAAMAARTKDKQAAGPA